MRRRHTFRAAVIETLEDRKLLSHASNPFTKLGQDISHFFSRGAKTHPARAARASALQAPNSMGQGVIPANNMTKATDFGLSTSKAPLTYASLLRGLSGGPTAAQLRGRAAGSTYAFGTPAGLNTPGALSADPRFVYMNPTGTAATPAFDTTTAMPSQAIAASPMSSFGPGVSSLPRPLGLTLSADDVSTLKSAVDTFAGSYTAGQNPAQDKIAVDALRAGLDNVASGIWSETHVTTTSAVAQLQKATNTFAGSYTGGVNPAQDRGAWRAYHAALRDFARSVTAPGGGAIYPRPGGLGLLPRMPVGGLSMVVANLSSGQGMTQDEVTRLRSAVDTFAANYTNGADPARDQAAMQALQTGLSGLPLAHGMTPPLSATPGGPPSRFLRTIDSPSVTSPVTRPTGLV